MRAPQSFAVASLMALSAASVAEPAQAQAQTQAHDAVAAEALFREGRAAADRGDFEAARVKFAESQRLDPSTGGLFNLAHAEEKVGRIASAWQHYYDVLGQLPPGDERIAFTRARVAALEPRLPRLTVRLSAALPPGAAVARDAIALAEGSLGTALPVDPGRHEVIARAPGCADRRYEVTLREAETRELIVEPLMPLAPALGLPPSRAAARRAPLPERSAPPGGPAPSDDRLRPLGWAVGSLGLVGLTLGAVAGFMTFEQKRIMKAHCDDHLMCSKEGFDAAQAGPVWGKISTAAFVIGAAGTGVGAFLIMRGSGSAKPAASASVSGRSLSVAVNGSF